MTDDFQILELIEHQKPSQQQDLLRLEILGYLNSDNSKIKLTGNNGFMEKPNYLGIDNELQASYYIGVDWLIDNKIAVEVSPKIENLDYLTMYSSALKISTIKEIEYFSKCYGINFDLPLIKTTKAQDQLTPLILIHYLTSLENLIKYGLKKMPVSGIDFMHSCEQAGYKKLPLEDLHIAELANLQRDEKAPPHNDPFDRILLSQAKSEGFYFVTHDPMFRGYNENCVIEV